MPSPMRSPGYANPRTWRRPSASTLKSAIAPVSTRYTWDTGSPSAKRNPFASTPRKEALVRLWSRSHVVGAETATRLVNDDGSRLYRVSIGISHLPVAHEILPFACECPEGFLNLGAPFGYPDQPRIPYAESRCWNSISGSANGRVDLASAPPRHVLAPRPLK